MNTIQKVYCQQHVIIVLPMDTDNNDNRTDVSPFWDRGQELKDAALAGEVAEAPKEKVYF